MSSRAWLIVSICGCAAASDPVEAPRRISAPPPARPAASRATPPVPSPAPPATAAVRSPERAEWPCGIDVMQRDIAERVFVYGGPDACWIPVDLLPEGVVGCPTEVVARPPRGERRAVARYEYDAEGHLTRAIDVVYERRITYEWDGDRIARATREAPKTKDAAYRYEETGDGVTIGREIESGLFTETRMSFVDGALRELDAPRCDTHLTLTWDGDRLVKVEGDSERGATYKRLIYECDPE